MKTTIKQRVLMVAIVAVAGVSAQSPVENLFSFGDLGLANGRLWNELREPGDKVIYMQGLLDEIKLVAMRRVQKEAPRDATVDAAYGIAMSDEWAKGFTIGDYVKILDGLYSQPENVIIPVAIAVRYYCAARLKGGNTAADLETLLVALRVAAREVEDGVKAGGKKAGK